MLTVRKQKQKGKTCRIHTREIAMSERIIFLCFFFQEWNKESRTFVSNFKFYIGAKKNENYCLSEEFTVYC